MRKYVIAVLFLLPCVSVMASCQTNQREVVTSSMENDIKVVVATSDKGMTIYQSPSKSALILTLVAEGRGGVFYQWTQKGKHILRDGQRDTYHSAIVIDDVNQWYKVSQEGITGYVSKDECKEAKILQITNEMIKEYFNPSQ